MTDISTHTLFKKQDYNVFSNSNVIKDIEMFTNRISVKKLSLLTATLSIGVLICSNALSHARWVIPSHTVVSGDNPITISIDYSISNAIFHPDIAIGGDTYLLSRKDNKASETMRTVMDEVKAILVTPNNKQQLLKSINLGRKTSTYFTTSVPGTYRIDIQQPPIDVTLYKRQTGEQSRLFGPLTTTKKQIPNDATDITEIQYQNKIQTYVTYNQINNTVVRPTGHGLELKQKTHPNELFANEKANYQIILNGSPLKGAAEVKVTKGGTRFRNQRNEIRPKVNNSGRFSVDWPESAMYLMEVEHETAINGKKTVYTLFLTLEVQPE